MTRISADAVAFGYAVSAVASVFFGVPLLLGRESPELVGPLYARQLQLVWAGARSRWG